ncbi:MAG TPA: glycosyltransferase family 39 protein, partial [Vicinamibacteria bacterium]|nr:glycosyltransferase family 39 protein [Vicinamibacteria bacterium]
MKLRALALALSACALGQTLWSGAHEGWTYDEAFHLRWSERFLETGVTERVSQERFNSKTPIMLPGVLARKAARALGVADPSALRFAARIPSCLWLLLLLALVYAAGRRLSPTAASLAVIAAALDPNLAAHASLATADMPFACATLATLLAADTLWKRPSAGPAVAVGVALGLAFVAKVSAFLLLPGLAVLPFLAPRPDAAAARRRALALLLLAAVTAWLTVCVAYGFTEFARPLESLGLRSALFTRLAAALPGWGVPLPGAFVTAFDASLASESQEFPVIVLGRRHPSGIWYYFAVVWAVKTPLLLLVAEVWGFVRAARDAGLRRHPFVRFLAWNLVLTLAYFSFLFRAQVGFRYVLMLVPLGYVLAAAGLATLPPRPRWALLGALVVASALAESAPYVGDPLAFTNAVVQPKRLAYRWLADSNID